MDSSRHIVKIFIAYSSNDLAFKEEIRKRLKPMMRAGKVEVWDNYDIEGGAKWDEVIRQKLSVSDIILLLLSPDALDSDYFYDVEAPLALQRHHSGEAIAVGVMLRPCALKHTPFELADYELLPKKGYPVTHPHWSSPDAAYLTIFEEIDLLVEKINANKVATPFNSLTSEAPLLQSTQAEAPILPKQEMIREQELPTKVNDSAKKEIRKISPLARKRAQELNISVQDIPLPIGAERVVLKDVLNYARQKINEKNSIHEFKIPSMGDQVTGRVLEILVNSGDLVRKGQVVAVVETDKVDIEIPAYLDGNIQEVLLQKGDYVEEGTVLLYVKTSLRIREQTIPMLGSDNSNVRLEKWLKSDGSTVLKGEALCEIVVEKASQELFAGVSGELRQMIAAGQQVRYGQTYALIVP